MPQSAKKIGVYFEVGKKRTFAGAVEWPGWCRSGRDDAAALQALLEYAPRYAGVLRAARLGFQPPADVSAFAAVERLAGNSTTDFGAPGLAPSADTRPVDAAALRRLQAVLKACWRALDAAVSSAAGKTLRKGPRGGGRDVRGIARHVLAAEAAYLSQLGWAFEPGNAAAPADLAHARQAALEGLAASARGELPARGPRGGLRWTPRYFTRRAAWHVLDHAWEIEDRL